MPWCLVPRPLVHPFNFFSVSAFLSTRRGPCRSKAPSTARAALGDHEPLIGRARWQSMGELRLGRIVTRTKGRGTKRQGTSTTLLVPPHLLFQNLPINCAALTGNGNMSDIRWLTTEGTKYSYVHWHSPRPVPDDWLYFRPTLVFAGHYLYMKNYSGQHLLFLLVHKIKLCWMRQELGISLVTRTVVLKIRGNL